MSDTEIDLGVRCPMCDRTNYILDTENSLLGCAYAIRGGLCQNYITLTPEELEHLRLCGYNRLGALALIQKEKNNDRPN